MLLCVCDPFALLVWKQEEEEGDIYEVYDDVMMGGGGGLNMFPKYWMVDTGRHHHLVGVVSYFAYDASWRPSQNLGFPNNLCLRS